MVNLTPWVLVPLYIYPSPNAWNDLYTAIGNNPNTMYRVIVNPASGPGKAGSFPDSNYITGVSKLNSYANTQILGYVDTAYATRQYSAVTQDIDTYVGWSKYRQADIHVDGIFFDDNPNANTAAPLTYVTNAAAYARKKVSNAHICLNPGTTVSDKWYAIADSIVAFEGPYTSFSAKSISAVSTSQRAKSVFIVYSFSGTTAQLKSTVATLYSGSIAGIFMTSSSDYTVLGSWWGTFASYVTTASSTTVSNAGKKNGRRNDDFVAISSVTTTAVTSHSQTTTPASKSTTKPSGTTSRATGRTTRSLPPAPNHPRPTASPRSTSKHTTSGTLSKPTQIPSKSAKQYPKPITTSHTTTISTKPSTTSSKPTTTATASGHITKKWVPRSWGAAAQPIEVY